MITTTLITLAALYSQNALADSLQFVCTGFYASQNERVNFSGTLKSTKKEPCPHSKASWTSKDKRFTFTAFANACEANTFTNLIVLDHVTNMEAAASTFGLDHQNNLSVRSPTLNVQLELSCQFEKTP